MKTMFGISQMLIPTGLDRNAFDKLMKTDVFPTVEVGSQTRGGIVTAQYLLKNESPDSEHNYAWIVHWQNQAGSPFGSRNTPPDPAPQLTAFGAKTSFTRYTIEAEQTQRIP